MDTITTEIRAFLVASGMTQKRLAEVSGLSEAAISRLMTGQQKDTSSRRGAILRRALALLTKEEPNKQIDSANVVESLSKPPETHR